MPEQENRPYLSEVIDYDRDIAPHQLIKIFAGVGSGKNTFVDNLAKGGVIKHADGTPVEKQYILLITSRRAKVNEQLNSDVVVYDPSIGMFDNILSDWYAQYDERYADYFEAPTKELSDLDGWGGSRIFKRTCVNTNAKIEYNLKQHFHPNDSASHPWERFDMIVIDEVHALLADASYQNAPFYVRRLIEETKRRSVTCKIIVMTGSPQILRNYALFDDAYCVDLMDTCRNIVPQRIEYICKKDAIEKQTKMLRQRQPFVAFSNHIGDMFTICKKQSGEIQDGIAISFSDEARRNIMKKEQPLNYKKMCDTEKHLAQYQTLPAGIHAFLTTSRNKEGVNIKNEDFRTMFVETHDDIDIIQMTGRLRNPIETLYIITDSKPHPNLEDTNEQPFCKSETVLNAVNVYFQKLCQSNNIDLTDPEGWHPVIHSVEPLGKFIDFIHNKFLYIRYDYFTDKFVYYQEREDSKAYYAEQQSLFQQASYSSARLIALTQRWFPNVSCVVSVKCKGDVAEEIRKYLTANSWLDGKRNIHDVERTEILEQINKITGGNYKTLAPALKDWGYLLNTNGKKKSSSSTITVLPEGEN